MQRQSHSAPAARALATWLLRASYVLSLMLIGVICAHFFAQERKQIAEINAISQHARKMIATARVELPKLVAASRSRSTPWSRDRIAVG